MARRVVCSECGKHSEIMDPPADTQGDVVWKCPKPVDNGVDLCGATNTTEV